MANHLPNFLCVGAQKAGTTTLRDILKQHPDVFLPVRKEAHFFDIEERYDSGIGFYEDTFFYNCKNEKAVGAVTPEYLYYSEVPGRILEHLGKEIKLIFMLRNPVDRAYSHYLMSCKREYEHLSFQEAIRVEPQRIKAGEFERSHFSYIERGLYAKQIQRYLDLFPRKNMIFVLFEEDFIKNREETIGNLLGFLDVEALNLRSRLKSNPATTTRSRLLRNFIYEPNSAKKLSRAILPGTLRKRISKYLRKLNQRPYRYEKLDPKFRASLIEKYFQEDIKLLEKMINRDLSHWLI